MRARIRIGAVVASAGVLGATAIAAAGGGQDASAVFAARLSGLQEVPAVSTAATGRFRAEQTDAGLEWRLRYEGIEGGAVQQAHIHLGQRRVNGGVSAFLCSNLAGAPAGVQACPAPPATLSGTIRAADVVGPANQGIAPGELAELVRAMRAGVTYANVHSAAFPGGEIRGQLQRRR